MRRQLFRRQRDVPSLDFLAALVDAARQGDAAAQAVLHDALLERYPREYKKVIAQAESPNAKVAGRAAWGPRVVLFSIDVARRAESERRPSRSRVLPAFRILPQRWLEGAEGYYDDVVTYVSRYQPSDRVRSRRLRGGAW